MGADLCQYWIEDNRCNHPLGPWVPDSVDVKSVTDVMTRTCEKCGGQQTQFRSTDPETNRSLNKLFETLKESK